MTDALAALVLGAGLGTRLRPLTWIRPKPLCPVANVPLVDHAIDAASRHTQEIAVNVHHHKEQMERHLGGHVRLSIEDPQPLGTAGAIGALLGWIDGRDLLVVNADRYHPDPLDVLFEGWQRDTVRLLTVEDPDNGDFGSARFTGASLLPWAFIRALPAEPSGLNATVWRPAREKGRFELVHSSAPFVDCGTLAEYHRANMLATNEGNAVAPNAEVRGALTRCVVWPGAHVREGERLTDAIRATDDLTVFVG